MHAMTEQAKRFPRGLRERGQGTVEYVGIVLAVGALLLALAGPLHGLANPIAKKVASAVSHAIDDTVGAGDGDDKG